MVRTRQVGATTGALAAFLSLLAFLPAGRAEDPALRDATMPPPQGTVYEDPMTSPEALALHDVRSVSVHAERGRMHVWVSFREPLKDGIFEGVDMYLDCDGDLESGFYGADLRVRAAVGSRFRPNTEPEPPPGLQVAFYRRTSGHATPYSASGSPTVMDGFMWRGPYLVQKPRVQDGVLHFSFPLRLLKEQGLRYDARVRLRFEVEGIISEQPVWLPYRCVDDGVAIAIDGNDGDWSGGPRATDVVDELHPRAETVDIEDLQVEHGQDALFARLRLAHPGFGDPTGLPLDGDVMVWDQLTFAFEPLGDAPYMEYRTVHVPVRLPRHRGETEAWAVGHRLAEIRIVRPPAQTAFRVMAWSDARRIDRVPDEGWLPYDVPAGAWSP